MREVFFLILCMVPSPLRNAIGTPSSSATLGLTPELENAQPDLYTKCYEFKNPPLRTYCALPGTVFIHDTSDLEFKCSLYGRSSVLNIRSIDLTRSCILMKIFSLSALFLDGGPKGVEILTLNECEWEAQLEDPLTVPGNYTDTAAVVVCEVNIHHSGESSCVAVREDSNEVVHCYFKEEVSAHESSLRCGNRGSDMNVPLLSGKHKLDQEMLIGLREEEVWIDWKEENIGQMRGATGLNSNGSGWNNSCVTVSMVGLMPRFFKRSCSKVYPAICYDNSGAEVFPFWGLHVFPTTNFSTAAAHCEERNETLLGNEIGPNTLMEEIHYILNTMTPFCDHFHSWVGGFKQQHSSNLCKAFDWYGNVHRYHACSDSLGYSCRKTNPMNLIWPPESKILYCGNWNQTDARRPLTCMERLYLNYEDSVAACAKHGMSLLPDCRHMSDYPVLLNDYEPNSYPNEVYSYWMKTSKREHEQCLALLGYDNQYIRYKMNCSARLRTVCLLNQRSDNEACKQFRTYTSCVPCVSENVTKVWKDLLSENSTQKILDGLKDLDKHLRVAADIHSMPTYLERMLKHFDTLLANLSTVADRADATQKLANGTVDLAEKTMQKEEIWETMDGEQRLNTIAGVLKTVEDFVIKMIEYQESSFVGSSLGSGNLTVQVMQLPAWKNRSKPDKGIELAGDSGSTVRLPPTSVKRGDTTVSVIFSENLLAKRIFDRTITSSAEPSSDSRVLLTPLVTASLVVNGTRVTRIQNGMVQLTFPYENHGNMGQPKCSFIKTNGNTTEWSEDGCTAEKQTNGTIVCSCNHLTIFAILMSPTSLTEGVEVLVCITQMGCGISILCLIACVVVFTACRRLRGISNTIHRNLCLSLLIAEILLLVGMKADKNNKDSCTIMAFFLHFLFLSAFGWMALEGCHIILLLWKVFNQRRSYYERYYLAGYGIPLVIASITLGSQYKSYSTKAGAYCWLPEEKYIRYSFIGPVAAVIFLNFGALLLVLWKMSQTHLLVDKSTAEKVKNWLRGTFILLPILGITWLLGFLMLGNGKMHVAGAYLFTIFNSLQGLGIFVCHVLLKKKARQEILKTVASLTSPLTNSASFRSSGSNSTSLTHTRDITSLSSDINTTTCTRQGRERLFQTLDETGNVSRPRRWWHGAFQYNLKISDANDRSM